MTQPAKPIAILCETCRSDDVSRDAWGDWNIAAQTWVLRTVFDHSYCHACDEESNLIEVPLAPDPSPSPTAVRFDTERFWVDLADGRTIGIPLAWFPRLLRASPAERAKVEMSADGLHWDAIDEDISIAGLLAGRRDQTRRTPN